MEVPMKSKPHVSFHFQVERILGVSSDGTYQVQLAPTWMSKFHLVGCEHLIHEFLQNQSTGEAQVVSENHFNEFDERADDLRDDNLDTNFQMTQLELNDGISVQPSFMKIEDDSESSYAKTEIFANIPNSYTLISAAATCSNSTTSNEFHCDSIYSETNDEGSSNYTESGNRSQSSDSISASKIAARKHHCSYNTSTLEDAHVSDSNDSISQDAVVRTSVMETESLKEPICSNVALMSDHTAPEPPFDGKYSRIPTIDASSFLSETTQKYVCNVCDKQYTSKNYFKTHLATHSGQNCFPCPYCEKKFAYPSGLSRHIRVQRHRKNNQPMRESQVISKNHFEEHDEGADDIGDNDLDTNFQMTQLELNGEDTIKIEGDNESSSYSLPHSTATCLNDTATLNEFHCDNIYPESNDKGSSGNKEYGDQSQCCVSLSTSETTSLKHRSGSFGEPLGSYNTLEHANISDRNNSICQDAGLSTSVMETESLEEPICSSVALVSDHTAPGPPCDDKHYRIPTIDASSFLSETTQKYVCNVCDKQYTSKNYFRIHLATHSGQNCFPCPYCEKKFAYHSGLSRHIRIHTHRKNPFACTYCDKTFARTDTLKSHQRVHTRV